MQYDVKKLKYKILLLFVVPMAVMVYFAFHFLQETNQNLHNISKEQHSLQQVIDILDAIHALQIERGLSAGCLSFEGYKEVSSFTKLQEARHQTDLTTAKLAPKQKALLHTLNTIRKKVDTDQIALHEQIEYYAHVIDKLISTVKYLLPRIERYKYDSLFLTDIERLKEAAGLERACIYTQLISSRKNTRCYEQTLFYQQQQKQILQNILLYTSPTTLTIYQENMRLINQAEIEELRKLFKHNLLDKKMADFWFKVATQRIDAFNNISAQTTAYIQKSLQDLYKDHLLKLNIAVFLWVIFFIAILYFIYLIEKFFKKYAKSLEEVKLASHTFNSYEGIVITKPDTTIIKVNNGFERITGYDRKELIGEKINILKSGKHPDKFYKKLWQSVHETGNWSGEILNKKRDGSIYHQRLSISAVYADDGKTVQYYVGHVFDISKLIESQEKAHYQATHDHLTDLINRKELLRRLQNELIRSKQRHFNDAFLFIDLDNFKNINDSYGHHVGDAVIQHIANTLKNSVRQEDIVARISGDEFGVVLLDFKGEPEISEKTIEAICHKIITKVKEPFSHENLKLSLSVSVGVRLFPLDSNDHVDHIMRDADFAMYQAKSNGKGNFVIFKK